MISRIHGVMAVGKTSRQSATLSDDAGVWNRHVK